MCFLLCFRQPRKGKTEMFVRYKYRKLGLLVANEATATFSLTENGVDVTGIGKTTVQKLWRTDYSKYDDESAEQRLFKIVVLHILPAIIKDYSATVDKILDKQEEEEKLETYMQLVRSCDLAFINVVLDLYIEGMCARKKGNQQFGEQGTRKKKKRGKKADKESLEHKEELYIQEVIALQEARKAKEGGGEDEEEKRLGWFRCAIKILADEREAERAEKEKENKNNADGKKRDGQQIGKEQAKKKRRRTLMGLLPNDGYQRYNSQHAATPIKVPRIIDISSPPTATEQV